MSIGEEFLFVSSVGLCLGTSEMLAERSQAAETTENVLPTGQAGKRLRVLVVIYTVFVNFYYKDRVFLFDPIDHRLSVVLADLRLAEDGLACAKGGKQSAAPSPDTSLWH
jgi:hypothetical protein